VLTGKILPPTNHYGAAGERGLGAVTMLWAHVAPTPRAVRTARLGPQAKALGQMAGPLLCAEYFFSELI
jgi:hypothetical protein